MFGVGGELLCNDVDFGCLQVSPTSIYFREWIHLVTGGRRTCS